MTDPNFRNRTLFTGDNLNIMCGMVDECVDLIYLDPPFNTRREHAAQIGKETEGLTFKDSWDASDERIEADYRSLESVPALQAALQAVGTIHSNGLRAYLTMMGVRLLQMRRILKPTGAIYLHCDAAASHYLKMVMDAIFGKASYRVEIIWKRTSSHNRIKKFGKITDSILFYEMSDHSTFNKIRIPYTEEYIEAEFRHEDERGRYALNSLTGPDTCKTDKEWRGYHPARIGRNWAIPNWAVESTLGKEALKLPAHERLEGLYRAGMVVISKNGIPTLKHHLNVAKGTALQTLWTDIPPLPGNSAEDIGYPTQKPIALLERIIQCSSNPDDLVLDPFCGSGTTLVAADRLQRRWVGIDISQSAAEPVMKRLMSECEGLFGEVHHETKPPNKENE